MSRSQPTSIRLPDDLKRDLLAIAHARKWELAVTIRNGLEEWVEYQMKALKGGRKK